MPTPEPDPCGHESHSHLNLSALLDTTAAGLDDERVSVRRIMESLGNRSFGFALVIFALPNSLPMIGIPGVSTITGLPILFIALQMAFGFERVYLPRWLADRSMAAADFKSVVASILPWVVRFETLTRPRLGSLVRPRIEPLLGLFCTALALLLILPIPFGNLLPALGILFIALGLIERDGICVLLGLAIGVLSWFVLGGLILIALHAVINLFHQF